MVIMEDIPKINTAIAEWMACLIFVLALPRRMSNLMTMFCMIGSLVLLIVIQTIIGIVPLYLWMVMMGVALIAMYGTIKLCCRLTSLEAGFYWAMAFMFAEFAASLEWQLYSFAVQSGYESDILQYFMLVICFGLTFGILLKMQLGKRNSELDLNVTKRDMYNVTSISIGAFLISNVSYVNISTPFSGKMSMEIFIIRTLVDFAGVILIVSLQDRMFDLQIRDEMKAINSMLQRQYDQYKRSRENVELINQKYHDLKHQIAFIRMEQDEKKKEEYLHKLESGVGILPDSHHTGNAILDTILAGKQIYCRQNGIQLNVVADGAKLGFMEVLDICSVFGNALDNAIESVEKLTDPEKRIVQVAVYTQSSFLMIRVENYYETMLHIRGDHYQTTKENMEYHGYGLKSIRYIAEKYGGSVKILTDDNCFSLRVLIPLPKDVE